MENVNENGWRELRGFVPESVTDDTIKLVFENAGGNLQNAINILFTMMET